MGTAFYWVSTRRGVVMPYRSFWTNYRSNLQGSGIQNKAGYPCMGFMYRREWAVESVSSVVPTSGVHVGLFPVISWRSPSWRFLYCQWPVFASRFISVWYWGTAISLSLIFHFYSLVHCSSLLISLLFWLSSIPHTCFHFVYRPCACLFTTE